MTARHHGERITASLATIPERLGVLSKVVGSLMPQVDKLCVCLNGHPNVPGFLRHPKVEILRSQEVGDIGDAAKFRWNHLPGYHLSCDDDIAYPPDYVNVMLSWVEYFKRQALVGVHGARVVEPVVGFYKSRQVFGAFGKLPAVTPVHMIGTGTLAWHMTTLAFTVADFKLPSMADIWVALKAKDAKVPSHIVPRPDQWLTNLLPRTAPSIFNAQQHKDQLQTELVRAASPWL